MSASIGYFEERGVPLSTMNNTSNLYGKRYGMCSGCVRAVVTVINSKKEVDNWVLLLMMRTVCR